MEVLSDLEAPDNVARTQLGLTPDVFKQLMSCFGGDYKKLDSYIKPLAEEFAVTDEASRVALSALAGPGGLSSWQFVRRYFTMHHMFELGAMKDLLSLGMKLSGSEVFVLLTRLPIVFGWLWPVLLKTRIDVDTPFDHPTEGRTTLRKVHELQCTHDEDCQAAHAPGQTTTLAQLACDGDFYAVLALIRRDEAISRLSEIHEKYLGRTVLEWARYYGRDSVAKELVFRYPFLAKEPVSEPSTATPTDIKNLKDTVENLQLEVHALKQELAQTKEHVGSCAQKVGNVGRNVSGLRKRLEVKSKKMEEMDAALKKDYVTRRGFKKFVAKMQERFNFSDDMGDEQ